EVLKGFQRDQGKKNGYEIFTVEGWDYPTLIETYEKAAQLAREEHIPVLIHVIQLTQPQGHSTSGSHERYKSPQRLEWEKEYECNLRMRNWIIANNIATEGELKELESGIKKIVRDGKTAAWNAHNAPIREKQQELVPL